MNVILVGFIVACVFNTAICYTMCKLHPNTPYPQWGKVVIGMAWVVSIPIWVDVVRKVTCQ